MNKYKNTFGECLNRHSVNTDCSLFFLTHGKKIQRKFNVYNRSVVCMKIQDIKQITQPDNNAEAESAVRVSPEISLLKK